MVAIGVGVLLAETYGKSVFSNALINHLQSSTWATTDNFNFEWPWHYLVFQGVIFSVFWFLLGIFAFKKFGHPYWRYSLLTPILYFLLTFDIAFAVYVLVVGAGGLFAYSKKASVQPSSVALH